MTRSVYLNISNIISSSSFGGGRSSGWEHGCTIPLKSKYKLSNSTLLGLGRVVSTGTFTPFISLGDSSMTRETILGYFLLSQRKAAGTLLLKLSTCGGIPHAEGLQCLSRTEISFIPCKQRREGNEGGVSGLSINKVADCFSSGAISRL